MPRRPTSDDAVQAARFFLESFIVKTESQDHILPKNDEFSPFSGFCRVYPQVGSSRFLSSQNRAQVKKNSEKI
jgi:hypothetical protein